MITQRNINVLVSITIRIQSDFLYSSKNLWKKKKTIFCVLLENIETLVMFGKTQKGWGTLARNSTCFLSISQTQTMFLNTIYVLNVNSNLPSHSSHSFFKLWKISWWKTTSSIWKEKILINVKIILNLLPYQAHLQPHAISPVVSSGHNTFELNSVVVTYFRQFHSSL